MAIFCVKTWVTLDFDQKNFYLGASFDNASQKFKFYTIKEMRFKKKAIFKKI